MLLHWAAFVRVWFTFRRFCVVRLFWTLAVAVCHWSRDVTTSSRWRHDVISPPLLLSSLSLNWWTNCCHFPYVFIVELNSNWLKATTFEMTPKWHQNDKWVRRVELNSNWLKVTKKVETTMGNGKFLFNDWKYLKCGTLELFSCCWFFGNLVSCPCGCNWLEMKVVKIHYLMKEFQHLIIWNGQFLMKWSYSIDEIANLVWHYLIEMMKKF